MVLTLGLVVMVIFLFLRNLSATIIPSLALPFSIVGTFAVMYLLNFSLDNLSMMALILSIGFVVDDAIVMLENIVRHIELGEQPLAGLAQGLGRDRLHHRVHDAVAGGRVHPGAVHGRRAGPAVQGIRHHHLRRHPDFGRGLRHPHAHAVQPVPALGARGEAELVLSRYREVLPGHAARLRRVADMGAALPAGDHGRLGGGPGRHSVYVRDHPQGLHPGPGHRSDAGLHGSLAGDFLLPDGGLRAEDRGPGIEGRQRGFADGQRGRRHRLQPGRPELRRAGGAPEAAQQAALGGERHHQGIASQAGRFGGHEILPAESAHHPDRRPGHQEPLPVLHADARQGGTVRPDGQASEAGGASAGRRGRDQRRGRARRRRSTLPSTATRRR